MARNFELNRLRHLLMDARYSKELQKRRVCGLYNKLQTQREESKPSIEYLNEEHDKAYAKMHEAYDLSEAAYARGDKRKGLKYSKKGRRKEAILANIIEARRKLTVDLKNMGTNLAEEKAILDQLNMVVNKARCDFRDWMGILNFVIRNQSEIAYNAGVPVKYLDNMKVELHADKSVHILFGGDNVPWGDEHAHYVVHQDGFVSYDRDPDESHGAHNFNTRVAKKASS